MPSKRQKIVKAGKEKYKDEFEFVVSELNKHDYHGLIEGGAPLDEFHFEAQKVLAAAKRVKNVEELQIEIFKIFDNAFGPNDLDGPKNYKQLANRIFSHLKN